MAWWDDLWTTITGYALGLWETIPAAADSAVNLTQGSFLWLAQLFGGLLSVVLYAPAKLLWVIIELINAVLSPITGVINAIISAGNSFMTLITGTFSNVLPGPWVALLGTIIILNIALRIYFFAKDISILGFKI